LVSDTLTKPSSGCSWLPAAGWSLGAASKLAANAAPKLPEEPFTGMFSVKLPSSGMHSLRQTSHAA